MALRLRLFTHARRQPQQSPSHGYLFALQIDSAIARCKYNMTRLLYAERVRDRVGVHLHATCDK